MKPNRTILGASLGDCVHVAGILQFMRLAEEQGYKTTFLGPAVPVERLIDEIEKTNPQMVAVSYRLSPESAERLLHHFRDSVFARGLAEYRYVFGGTTPVCRVAEQTGVFDKVFDSHAGPEDVAAYLKGESEKSRDIPWPDSLVDRIDFKAPYPLIRHHFGQPNLKETIEGAAELAESGVLDVISIGPDQNAQQYFFRPEQMDPNEDGAGGVPVRTPDDLRAIYEASRVGNKPLVRCYSGTEDVFKMAKMLLETINNAWSAIPLCWYNVLDGRGSRRVLDQISEARELISWHAERDVPVEVNEAHHWSLRYAHDTIAVTMAYLAAYNAKAAGVENYVAQYMFNTPKGTSFPMDLAKMLAKRELIESLADDDFRVITQVRSGLFSLPADMDKAKGHLASSTYLQMALKPDIVHVVAYCEADHVAKPREIIESCKIAQGVIENALSGMPDMARDDQVVKRKNELIAEARVLLSAIRELGTKLRHTDDTDPWTDPETLAAAIEVGLLDAPHLMGNPNACGTLRTRLVDGAYYAVDPETSEIISEAERVARILGKTDN